MNEENMNVSNQAQPEEYAVEQPVSEPVSPKSPKKPSIIGSVLIIVVGVAAIIASALMILGNIGVTAPYIPRPESGAPGTALDSEDVEFIDELGGVSETFEGVLSNSSFDSSEEAAEAFVTNELSGNGIALVDKVESKGELSDSEIEALNLPEYILDECDEVEKFEVTYEIDDPYALSSGVSGIAKKSNEKTAVVYVIKCGPDWKYFAPLPENGKTINKSYYDSVFNSESYSNCTMETEMTVTASAEAKEEGQSMKMEIKTTQLIKYADNRIYMEQTMYVMQKVKDDRTGEYLMNEEESETIIVYIEETNDGTVCYVKDNNTGRWNKAYLFQIGFSSVEELRPFYDQYLDYTYFTKSSFGFELAEENAEKYLEDALGQALQGVGATAGDDMDLNMYAKYYVNKGTLSGMRVDADINLSLSVDGSTATMKEGVTAITKCTNYGSTVVERPDVD